MKYRILAAALAVAAPLAAHAQNVVVSPWNMQGWVFFDDAAGTPCLPTSTCEIVAAPVPASDGDIGSAHLTTTGNNDRPRLGVRSAAVAGKRFADLLTLTYRTYVASSANPAAAIALQFEFDNNVTDADTTFKGRIVFEPYWQGANPVVGEWQTWNAGAGRWWLTRATQLGIAPGQPCSADSPCTLATLTASMPNAGVRATAAEPNMLLAAGSYWPLFDGYADALTVQFAPALPTTYDFDTGPRTKDECKDNGWVGYTRNQGECVSRFASGW